METSTITTILLTAAILTTYVLYSSRKKKDEPDAIQIGRGVLQLKTVRRTSATALGFLSYGLLISTYYSSQGLY